MNQREIGGICLVSGTTIGAAMLALPISTGTAGFIPSAVLFTVLWAYLAFTGFLVLEATFWMPEESNMITMAKATLGKLGALVSGGAYLFLLYALLTAFLAGGGHITADVAELFWDISIPQWAGPLPMLLLFGYFVFQGTRQVDQANRLMMLGLVVGFVALLWVMTPHMEPELLNHTDWSLVLPASFVVVTSFGYHIVIPSLATYLNREKKSLLRVIVIGSAVPLIVYLVWEAACLAVLPVEGPHSITSAKASGQGASFVLVHFLGTSSVSLWARVFSICAIVTTFLGVSLSLIDFLADGLGIKKDLNGKLKLTPLTFLPPLIVVWTDPSIFLNALDAAGAYGVVILLALVPALMVWRGRYVQKRISIYQAPGGKGALALVIGFSVLLVLTKLLLSFKILEIS